MGNALEDIGFFAVVDHDVDADLIKTAYRLAQAFFELPESVKRQYEDPKLNGQRGFTRFGREHAKDHPVPDLKEFWHVGRESRLANLRPRELPQFHDVMSDLYAQLDACAATLLEACALYLGEPPLAQGATPQEPRLRSIADNSDTILRVIHYPPIPETVDASSLRAAPHEDINLITLLCGATANGLELLQRDGTWLAIPALEGQIIVDSGDMLQNLTNGLLKSTTHRVTNPNNAHERRFSMPFFVHPAPQTDLTPLQGCINRTGGTQTFPAITAGDYLRLRLEEIGLAS